jgi:putative phosphoribosyl transferase
MALSIYSERIRIQAGKVEMEGMLRLPQDQIGIVLFAGSTGSNRIKPPNDYVGSVLRNARLGTLWLELFTPGEERSRQGDDIEALTQRLGAACDWLAQHDATRDVPMGMYGASSGAAAAMQLAAERGRAISAIVSRGGRPDLASHGILGKIHAPTLLIVGGLDEGGVHLNRAAYAALRCRKRLEIIPGATRTFEEPGSLEVVARLARGWFLQNAQVTHV